MVKTAARDPAETAGQAEWEETAAARHPPAEVRAARREPTV